jgi:L-fuconolactonase
VVDAHVHVWDPAVAPYPWLTPDVSALDRAFALTDVAGALTGCAVDRVVLVQASDSLADTANMFAQAFGGTSGVDVAGIVAWVPLTAPARARQLLDAWAGLPVVGVRHLVHREADPRWLLHKDVTGGLNLLAGRGLTFDVCAETPELLALVPALADRHPDVTFVVDHLGKPPIAAGGWQPWADLLSRAAARSNVTAKISGLNTAAGPGWVPGDLQRYVDHAVREFGTGRLMAGGDWPFALLAASGYAHVWRGVTDTLAALPAHDRAAIRGGNAAAIYHLQPGPG